jgi:zinc transport system substrate-binding protein
MLRTRLTLALLAVALLLAGCAPAAQGTGPIQVAVSIAPLADMVRQIGGERVTVVQLVPAGSSVHTYEPSPRQVQFVSRAQLLVLNGAGLEYWASKVIDAAANPKLHVVDTSQGLPLLEESGEQGGNPHLWLDPELAMRQAEKVRDGLIAVDPDHADLYRQNAERYLATLQALDAEIQAETATWTHRRFVAFHSAWVYFARRYGLEQVAAIEPFPGREPSPEWLANIVTTIRQSNVPVVFAEPQLPPRAAQAVASEAGARVLTLDPLGGVPGRSTYVDLMRYNVSQMAQALR